MRILHLADLHLGKKLNDLSLIKEQRFFIDWAVKLVEEESIDVVIIAGDVYDRSIAPSEAIALLDYFLTALVRLNCQILIIPGNHDSAERLAFAAEVLKAKSVYIAGRSPDFLERVILEAKGSRVCFDLLPFMRAVDLLALEPEAPILSAELAVEAALKRLPPPRNLPSVLIAHQFVTAEAKEPELSESERAYVGPADQVSSELFAAYDYVALGHIHRPQAVGRESCRYAGAPMPFRFGEEELERSCPIVEFSPSSREPSIEFKTIPQAKKLLSKSGSFNDIKALLYSDTAEARELRESYCEIVLSDRTVPDRAFASLREALPNLIRLRFSALEPSSVKIPQQRPEELGLLELFKNFYKANSGSDLDSPILQRLEREVKEYEEEGGEECDL